MSNFKTRDEDEETPFHRWRMREEEVEEEHRPETIDDLLDAEEEQKNDTDFNFYVNYNFAG